MILAGDNGHGSINSWQKTTSTNRSVVLLKGSDFPRDRHENNGTTAWEPCQVLSLAIRRSRQIVGQAPRHAKGLVLSPGVQLPHD